MASVSSVAREYFGRLFRTEPFEIQLHLGTALEAPAGRQADHLDALAGPVEPQFFQQFLDRIGAYTGTARPVLIVQLDKQFFQTVDRQRLTSA